MKKVKCYKRKSILTLILIVPSYKETPNLAIFNLKYSKTCFSGFHKDPDFICSITWPHCHSSTIYSGFWLLISPSTMCSPLWIRGRTLQASEFSRYKYFSDSIFSGEIIQPRNLVLCVYSKGPRILCYINNEN